MNDHHRQECPVILYVEDDQTTAQLFRIILADLVESTRLFVVESRDAALRFLLRQDSCLDAPRPDLMVLDVSLPGESGLSLLEELRRTATLAAIPAVFFTNSDTWENRERARSLGALKFLTKPASLTEFQHAVQEIRALVA